MCYGHFVSLAQGRSVRSPNAGFSLMCYGHFVSLAQGRSVRSPNVSITLICYRAFRKPRAGALGSLTECPFRKPRAGALGSLTECPPDIRPFGYVSSSSTPPPPQNLKPSKPPYSTTPPPFIRYSCQNSLTFGLCSVELLIAFFY
jgi:hypothetical protein